jgi:L-ornithine N5-oxygenase
MDERSSRDDTVHDVVGIGFGPANLALAIAVREHNHTARDPLSAVFLEKKPRFGWHSGMLLDNARMQISFLKDLVTLRAPTSDFSFVSFLAAQGRLIDFINHQNLFPSRAEFHRYLEWAAARVAGAVRYGRTVSDVRPRYEGTDVTALEVITAEGDRYRARNVVVATGLRPVMPPSIAESDRIWHNARLLDRLREEPGRAARRFLVIGAGQSAAETVAHLHGQVPGATVYSVFSRFGYAPADDTPFANGIFDPESVAAFYDSSPEVKDMLTGYHRNTNYSVVDRELIHELYRRAYEEKVSGERRLRVLNASRVTSVEQTGHGVRVRVAHLPSGTVTPVTVDVVVYATGYGPTDPVQVLGSAADLCKRDSEDRPRMAADYRVLTASNVRCGIFVQGATEHSHGLASTLLSNTAVRAGDILSAVLACPGRTG